MKRIISLIFGGRNILDIYEYGTCNNLPARKNRINGNVQFVLHKAGHAGHKDDYWHNFNESWWTEFKTI